MSDRGPAPTPAPLPGPDALLGMFAEAQALRDRGLFAAEGRFVVERLLRAGTYTPVLVAVTPGARAEMAPLLDALPQSATVLELPPRDLQALVGYPLDRGCVAVVRRPPPREAAEVLGDAAGPGGVWLVLEEVSNPDNAGSLFRTAAAFGVRGVVLAGGCADPYYRKAVRTSLGNTLTVAFASAAGAPEAHDALLRAGVVSAALVARGGAPVHDWSPAASRIALWLGHEGRGLSDAAQAACRDRVTIAMPGAIDSLNVAVAGAIALHHVTTAGPR